MINQSITNAGKYNRIKDEIYSIPNPYVGNKRKIIPDILDFLDRKIPDCKNIVDLFSGSASVSMALKLLGKNVISNELLTSSYYSAVLYVENSDPINKDIIKDLLNTKSDSINFVKENYLNRFSEDEAKILDSYRSNIEKANLSKFDKAAAFAVMQNYVIDHCFVGGRLNNGQVLASKQHRIDHQRNKNISLNNEMTFDLLNVTYNNKYFKTFNKKNEDQILQAYNLDAFDFLDQNKNEIDLIYIDPPYGGSQSDYSNMFSFFEEYIYLKNIDDLDHIKKCADFSKKKTYIEQFKILLEKASMAKQLLFSYNNDSFADIDTILELVQQFRKNVSHIEIDYNYKYRKSGSTKGMEYLILAS